MKNIVLLVLLTILVTGCMERSKTDRLPAFASVAAERVNIEGDSTTVYIGGYGSSIVYNPTDSCFYLLTDRGPNCDGMTPESKVFPIPDYTPTIGRFRLTGDSLVLVEKIALKESDGTPFTGLPNREGNGVTGEVAYHLSGEVIVNRARGIDTEGLAIAPDGTFWVSDEYGPFVMQFDRTGILLRELSPTEGLPAYFAQRRPNRGMEGLTITTDGRKLFGALQSPLYLPDPSTKDQSVNNRIVEIDIETGKTREFIYLLENPLNVVSEICYKNDSTLLVLERDGNFPKDDKGFKRVYKIDITHATDISGKVIEQLSPLELQAQQIQTVSKELFVDILSAIPHYRHDKPEGITLIGDSILCVANDDDFGITATSDGKYAPKLDTDGLLDRNVVYFIPVAKK